MRLIDIKYLQKCFVLSFLSTLNINKFCCFRKKIYYFFVYLIFLILFYFIKEIIFSNLVKKFQQ